MENSVVQQQQDDGQATKPSAALLGMCAKHPHHLLLLQTDYSTSSCICDVCKTTLLHAGDAAWQCKACDFDVCARCMDSFSVPVKVLNNQSSTSSKPYLRPWFKDEFLSSAYFVQCLQQHQKKYRISAETMRELTQTALDVNGALKCKKSRNGVEEMRQAYGISSAADCKTLMRAAEEEAMRAKAQAALVDKPVPDEYFSYVWLVSRLYQSGLVDGSTIRVLGANKVSLCALKEMSLDQLEHLGIDELRERQIVFEYAAHLEAALFA